MAAMRHAIVTGGSSGIGYAIVRQLLGDGYRVTVIALDDAALKALADSDFDLSRNGDLRTEPADVSDRNAVERAVQHAVADGGRCDLLVTSAGIGGAGRFLELDSTEFERHMSVNYLGTLYPVRAVARSMMERRAGTIVLISSFAALLGVYGYSAYAPPKYAVRGLAETLRTELRPHGIRVACAFPTDVDTPMLAAAHATMPPETRALAGSAGRLPAERAAAAILRGVRRGRCRIFCDRRSAFLARFAELAPGLIRRLIDRKVRSVTGSTPRLR